MKTIKAVAGALVLTIVLPGCATRPVDIAPQQVSAMRYDERTCKQLVREMDDVDSSLAAASGRLDSKATQDAWVVGVTAVLFWPAAFALGGNQGMEQEVARLKGEQIALKRKMRDLNCDEPKTVPPTPQVAPVQSAPPLVIPTAMSSTGSK